MKKYNSDLSRALGSWGFYAGIAGFVVAIIIGASGDIVPMLQMPEMNGLYNGFHAQTLLTALSSDVMLLCVPILAALPYTSAFVDDCKSGYLKEYLPRCGQRRYIRGKVAATAVSGALVLFVGVIIAYILFALVFTPMELKPDEEMMQMMQPHYFADILGRAFVFALCGALWSLVGAMLAAVTMSKYMAYASPFIIYYVLVILSERYIKDVYVLNPKQWLGAGEVWPGGIWGIALLVAQLAAIVAIAYGVRVSRRLADA